MHEIEIKLDAAACPKCGSISSSEIAANVDHLYGVPGVFHAAECTKCGFWFQNPRPEPDQLDKLYPDDYGPHAAVKPASFQASAEPAEKASLLCDLLQRLEARFFWRLEPRSYVSRHMAYRHIPTEPGGVFRPSKWPVFDFAKRRRFGLELLPRYVEGGRLLEVGCATGARLDALRKLGWSDLHGLEMVKDAAEKARDRGFKVKTGPVEEILSTYPDASFDVIVSSMVLEHLFNPFAVVRALALKLKPGGEFLFSTISRDAVDARMYRNYWAGFDFPRHMVYFSRKDLRDMIADDFTNAEYYHQSAFIDFVRSASWRIRDGRGTLCDRMIVALGNTGLTNALIGPFAWAGLTMRVFIRCTRKSP